MKTIKAENYNGKQMRLPEDVWNWIYNFRQKHLELYGITYSPSEIMKMTFFEGIEAMNQKLENKKSV